MDTTKIKNLDQLKADFFQFSNAKQMEENLTLLMQSAQGSRDQEAWSPDDHSNIFHTYTQLLFIIRQLAD